MLSKKGKIGRINSTALKTIFWMEKVLSFELTTNNYSLSTNLLEDF